MQILKTKSATQMAMLVILLLATWTGTRSLTVDTIWYDEWYSLYYAGAAPHYGPVTPMQTVDRALQYNEYNPPGYYVILNLWGKVAGWTPFVGRAVGLLFGILALAVVYRLGYKMADKTTGLATAIALAASAFFVSQLNEIRMYTLFILLVSLTLLAYWQFTYRKPNRQNAALFFISLLGLLYTHYMALPLVLSLGIYHLLIAPKNRPWWVISVIAVVCGLLYLPWLTVAFSALGVVSGESSRNFFASDALTLINNVLTQFSNGAVPLLVIAGWYALRNVRRSALFVFSLLICTFGLILLINERLHFIGIARYLIGLWPVLALIVGLGVAQMQRFKLRPALLVTIWCLAGIGLIIPRKLISEPKDPFWEVTLRWDKVAQVVNEDFFGRVNDQDKLVFLLPQPTPFWFHAPLVDYYLHQFRVQVDNMPGWLHISSPESPLLHAHLVESLEGTTPEMFANEAEQFLTNSQRIWVAYTPAELPSPFVRPAWDKALANQGFVACTPILQEPTLQMNLYARLPEDRLTAHFGDGIRVGALDTALSSEANRISMLLGWSIATDVPANTYSIGLYVDNAQGQPVAQTDFGIPNQPSACSRTAISLAGLPTGSYTLSAAVYNWQTGERLSGKSTMGLVGDRPQLVQFTIP